MAPKTETKQWKDGAATDLSCRILRSNRWWDGIHSSLLDMPIRHQEGLLLGGGWWSSFPPLTLMLILPLAILCRTRSSLRPSSRCWPTPRTTSSTRPRSPRRCFLAPSSNCCAPRCPGSCGPTSNAGTAALLGCRLPGEGRAPPQSKPKADPRAPPHWLGNRRGACPLGIADQPVDGETKSRQKAQPSCLPPTPLWWENIAQGSLSVSLPHPACSLPEH